jgi:hypothetical protein
MYEPQSMTSLLQLCTDELSTVDEQSAVPATVGRACATQLLPSPSAEGGSNTELASNIAAVHSQARICLCWALQGT